MNEIKVLDHGYLKFIDSYGSDESIIEAARMSTAKGFLGWDPGPCPHCQGSGVDEVEPTSEGINITGCTTCAGKGTLAGDAKLLAFLYNNNHSTPFEMAGMTIEVQAPIFVFREWHRHRTQSYNEMSARYTPLPDVNYIPTVDRLMINASGTNKQAGTVAGSLALDEASAIAFQMGLRIAYQQDEQFYQWALGAGVPKELARCGIPVGRYSRMRAHANLRNWLGFLTLRTAPNAQYEIRQYAAAVAQYIQELFPRTYELFIGKLDFELPTVVGR